MSLPFCSARLSQSFNTGHQNRVEFGLLHAAGDVHRLLSIGGRPDGLQVLLHAPVAGSLQAGRVVEGFRFLGARLGIEDIDRVHVVVLTTDVLVHENGRQVWPNHCSAEGAQLDHVAKALWARLRSGEELVSHDHELAEAAGHGDVSVQTWGSHNHGSPTGSRIKAGVNTSLQQTTKLSGILELA